MSEHIPEDMLVEWVRAHRQQFQSGLKEALAAVRGGWRPPSTEREEQRGISTSAKPSTLGPFSLCGFATGGYLCTCRACGTTFQGGKRAFKCLPCAAQSAAASISELTAERDRLKEVEQAFSDAATARDYAGYLGTPADCIRDLSAEQDRLLQEYTALARVVVLERERAERAEARITTLEAALEEAGEAVSVLAGALEPFAEHAADYDEEILDDQNVWPTFLVGDFRQAADALASARQALTSSSGGRNEPAQTLRGGGEP